MEVIDTIAVILIFIGGMLGFYKLIKAIINNRNNLK